VLLLAAGSGFTFGDTYAFGILFLGVAVFAAVGALSHQRERAFSASLIYLALGVLAAATLELAGIRWVDPIENSVLVERLTEVAVVFALFATGLSLDRPLAWREWSTTARLLAIVMPLTIGAVALFASQVMGLSLAAAVLLGAVLSPTDPVLAGDVGVGPPGEEDEREPNFSLTSEAGLNDGLAFPFVLLGILLAEGATTGGWLEWLGADVFYALLGGVVVGAALGWAAAASIKGLRDRELLAPWLDGYHAVATTLLLYGSAEVLSVYGFVAVFVGGLAFRRYERDHEANARVHTGGDQSEKLLALASVLMLGSMLSLSGLTVPGWEGWLLAVLLIIAIRPLSCIVALWRSKLDEPYERVFVSWFGVRGIGSLYYMAFAVGEGVLSGREERLVVWTTIACVLLSIAVHGITAGPSVARLLARQEDDDRVTPPVPGRETSPARR
jgi:NhaP-type Na+/H+ or K+/H+ antiporter